MPRWLLLALGLSLVIGCASGSGSAPSGTRAATAPPPAAAPAAATAPPAAAPTGGDGCRKDDKLQRICLAGGFSPRGYDTLYIVETLAEIPKLNPDGKANLEWAQGVLREELVAAIRQKGLFTTVVTREADVAPGGKTLRLENTIVEYEKGGGGARYWAGLYGAGQPVIKVRGRLLDGDRQVLLFETRRSGVGGKARWLGGYMDNREIQTRDIQDLVGAVADFLAAPR